MNFNGAIFDLDGTLLDSMVMWRNLAIRYLNMKGVYETGNIVAEIRYSPLKDACRHISEKYINSLSPQEVYDEIMQMIYDFYKNEVNFKPGAREYLDHLKEKGIKMSLATSTDREFFIPALKRLDGEKYFEGYVTDVEVGKSKHFPHIYNRAREIIGTDISKTTVFEDIYVGANTAKCAGYRVVGVYDIMAEPESESLKKVCDIYVRTLDELI